MSRALFGRDVIDLDTGTILDQRLSRHGYQLWTAAVGTIIEAQARGQGRAVLLVHQFLPADPAASKVAGDARDWASETAENHRAIAEFTQDLELAGAVSRETEFVKAGTRLIVVKARTIMEACPGDRTAGRHEL